jgi:hypothetical protein
MRPFKLQVSTALDARNNRDMYIYSSEFELAIEGTVRELNNIADVISGLDAGDIFRLRGEADKSAEPYDIMLRELILSCVDTKIKCSVLDGALKLEFPKESKVVVASYFSYFTARSKVSEHCHLDKIGNETIFDDDSIDTVVQVQGDEI